MKLVLYVSIDNNINIAINAYLTFRYNECLHLYFVHSIVKFLFSSDSKVKSRKYQGVFEVKSRVKTWQVRGIWSQQLEH